MGANFKAGKSASATPPALLTAYLEHLAHERRLSAHTVRSYGRDIHALLEQTACPVHELIALLYVNP